MGSFNTVCPYCGGNVPEGRYKCPTCKEILATGVPLLTKRPTTVVDGHGGPLAFPRTTNMPVTRHVMSSRHSVMAAAVTFDEMAHVHFGFTPVDKIEGINLTLGNNTNGAAALKEAHRLLLKGPETYSTSAVLVLSDGEFNHGGVWLSFGAKKAAIDEADALKQARVRIGAIYYGGGDSDPDCLRQIVSSPSFYMEAQCGGLVRAMVSLTRTLTRTALPSAGRSASGIAIVFAIDCSGSMGQMNKKAEAEASFLKCVEDLRNLQ